MRPSPRFADAGCCCLAIDGDGTRDLLVGFDPRQVAAYSPRARAVWLVGAVRDRSRGVYGYVARER